MKVTIFISYTINHHLRGPNTKKIFVYFNAMQFIFGQVLGHSTTNIKISFSKLHCHGYHVNYSLMMKNPYICKHDISTTMNDKNLK